MKSTHVISCSFALALTVFEILTFEIYDLEKVGEGERVQFIHLQGIILRLPKWSEPKRAIVLFTRLCQS